jgi:hypothetical protein
MAFIKSRSHQSAEAEAKFVATSVKGWIDHGIAPSEIGIAAGVVANLHGSADASTRHVAKSVDER